MCIGQANHRGRRRRSQVRERRGEGVKITYVSHGKRHQQLKCQRQCRNVYLAAIRSTVVNTIQQKMGLRLNRAMVLSGSK